MKLLVTGGLGFIGSNFILKTLHEKEGFDIVDVDAELSTESYLDTEGLQIVFHTILK